MANGDRLKKYDVFLSHGSPDKLWVIQLHARLEALGVSAYLDETEIRSGQNFVLNLSDAIGRASTFIIVVSQDTTERPWVAQEWTSFMATHGPNTAIIPVLLDHVQLPPFLRPYQAIHATDRGVDAVAARIAGALGKENSSRPSTTPELMPALYTGRTLTFTIASIEESDQLAVTSADGARRMATAPWRQGNAFGLALMEFERLTRESTRDDATRALLTHAAQTLGGALFGVLFSDETSRANFARATAPGARPVVTVLSDDDVLLSLPWELLFHDSRFLVRDGVIDVLRSTTGPVQFETQLTPPSEPFAVVTHIAAPEGSALSYEAESYRITHALTDYCQQTATELGTFDDLVETVTRTKPRGIHFSGHGTPGTLMFEDDEGFEAPVPIERLVTSLRQQSDGVLPPFFFLASCHGNTPAEPAEDKSGSGSSAAQLHRAGVTQVVGYYGPIGDELSTRAEEALYAAVAAGESTRLAVTRARAALLREFDEDAPHRPASLGDVAPLRSGHATAGSSVHVAPFAWAQLVFYHRGPEHPLGTPASQKKLRQREASLQRTYRNVADRAFLATGFIGRRQELHQLRRRRKRGDRVFVLQGLGGLGKTTLAGHLLPSLADAEHTVTIWCRRSEGESDQAESLVGQLLSYARARFGPGFEQIVGHVDRAVGADAAQRFAAFLQIILDQGVPLVLYFDNLESLLQGPHAVSLDSPPDPEAFGAWRTDALQRLWRVVADLASSVKELYVVASCRYRNDDLMASLLSVSPLADVDLFRLMAWFPALRQLSSRTRGALASRLSGHPRAVEFLDTLIAASIRAWESSNGEWTAPMPHDEDACRREWDRLVDPVLPKVDERIWSDLLLAALWDRVLDTRARRMLFRMTLLRSPWDEGLLRHLGEPDDDADVAQHTAHALTATSLLEQINLSTPRGRGHSMRAFYMLHAATTAFVKIRFGEAADLVIETYRRIGTHLEERARTASDLSVAIEAGYHLFEAGEYDRALKLCAIVSSQLNRWGRFRESVALLSPFLPDAVHRQASPDLVVALFGLLGIGCASLGEYHRAIDFYERQLVIAREIGNPRQEGGALGNLGNVYNYLGEVRRAMDFYEQHLVIARKIGDRYGESNTLGNLGNAYYVLDETHRAIDFFEQQLAIAREIGNRNAELNAIGSLGNGYYRLGETRRAIDQYEQTLVMSRELGDRPGEGRSLGNLGNAYVALGEFRRAMDFHEKQLAIVREIGDRRGECTAVYNLGAAYHTLGENRRAIDFFEQSLVIARTLLDTRMIGLCEKALKILSRP